MSIINPLLKIGTPAACMLVASFTSGDFIKAVLLFA